MTNAIVMALEGPLAAMRQYRQFVIYFKRPIRSGKRAGKYDKLPCDTSGCVVSAHDSKNWLDADAAIKGASDLGEGYGVGFVFTDGDPFWALDIDHCLINGQWSPVAMQLCQRLNGASVEVSPSGTGLHIMGSGIPPAHKCRNGALGLEFYNTDRFMTLTGIGTVGNVGTDFTAMLPAFVEEYFKPNGLDDIENGDGDEWTTTPREDWFGSDDDDELIRRALQSKSSASAFGGRASFADLWSANADVLSKCYPDSDRPYDESSADAALAQHLAFWAGSNCERIERLMRKSGLVRDKWDRTSDPYLRRTILFAVSQQVDVFVDETSRRHEQIDETMRIGEGSDELRLAGTITLNDMLSRFVFVQDGQQVVDLQQPQHISLLSDFKSALKASTTNLEVSGQFNMDGTPKVKSYETSTLWEKSTQRQIAHSVTFKAGARRLVRDPKGREAVNIWTPLERNVPGIIPDDPHVFIEHVNYLFGVDASRFLDWLAHIEQYPGELPQSGWLHISKKHGSGRNWIAGVIARLWPGYAAINFNLKLMLNSGYNDRLSNKLIAVVDEIKDGGTNAKWDNAETMRSIMTEEFRTINPKYGRMREEFNSCRWLIFSNHIGALALDEEDRRLDVVNIDVMPKSLDYYSHLYRLLRRREFIAGVAQMLSTRNLSSFNPGAHAIVNKAKEDVIASSRSEADEILIELVNSWPVDVIHNSVLGELVTGQLGGKITGAHRHAFQRHGVKPYKSILKIKGTVVRVSILRNSEIWKNADPIQIRSEINRGPELPFGGARAFLDNLTAV